MWLDLLASAVVLLTAVTGAWRGGVSALWRLGVLAGSYVAARLVAPTVAPAFAGPTVTAPFVAEAEAGFVSFLALWWLASALASNLLGRLYDGPPTQASRSSRLLGGTLSGARAGVAILIVLSGWQYANRWLGERVPALWVDLESAHVGQWVRGHNAFLTESFPHQWALMRLAEECASQRWREAPEGSSVERILAHPEARALFDPSIQQAIAAGDGARVLADEGIRSMRSRPELRRVLDTIGTGPVQPAAATAGPRLPALPDGAGDRPAANVGAPGAP